MRARAAAAALPLFLIAALAGSASPAKAPAADAAFFRDQVRPLLERRCASCHAGPRPQARLDLSTRAAVLRGSARPVALPGRAAESLLVQRVAAGTMPPAGKLPPAEIAVLRRWVDGGLPWDGGPVEVRRAGADWWSLQPLRPVAPPAAAPDREPVPPESRAVDAFVGHALRRAGLSFAPEASPAAYIRRVTYDLHGLAPTPEEVDAFVNDRAPGARARLVDRLLASPRYGERAGRRWLDAVRFAESDGYEHDLPRPNAWPYRDWVIRAFNEDMPYDRFVREQVAGDALRPGTPDAGVPTGFLVAGGYDAVGAKVESASMRAEVRQDELEDMIGVTTQVFLGLTARCARCHDHKFDPIPQADYYRLAAALAGARHWGPNGKSDHYGVRSEDPPPVRLLKRGSLQEPGPVVAPGGLSALRMLPRDLPLSAGDGDPARRRALAEWLVHPRSPLPARVMANRVWGWLFGQGLVATPDDFGFNGDRPSHPELLEWLAAAFLGRAPGAEPMAGSVKRLHRALVLSRAYRQSSAWNERAARADAGNRLLWRHAPRRLEAEEVRDSMLAAAGRLNLKAGGPGFQLFTYTNNAGALYQPVDPEGEEYCRRAVYRMVVRGGEDTLLAGLDCPDASNPTPRRQSTTTATQALSLLNNSFVDRQSGHFAERLRREAPSGPPEQVRLGCRLALGRLPEAPEADAAAAFIERRGLKAWCRVLFNASEFMYVD